MENFKQKLHKIKCFIFDLDGVLTDGTLLVMPDEFFRTMNIKDGFALKTAVDAGYHIAIISGAKSQSTIKRFNNLGIKDVYIGVQDKTEVYNEVLKKFSLKEEEVLFMGDDLPDYKVMKRSGVACCPADAVHEICEISSYISSKKGGEGCVRDVIEQVLRLHGKWIVFN